MLKMTPIEKLRQAASLSLSGEMEEPQSATVEELLKVCDTCIVAAREALPEMERRRSVAMQLVWLAKDEEDRIDAAKSEISDLRAMQARLIAALECEIGFALAPDSEWRLMPDTVALVAELKERGEWPE